KDVVAQISDDTHCGRLRSSSGANDRALPNLQPPSYHPNSCAVSGGGKEPSANGFSAACRRAYSFMSPTKRIAPCLPSTHAIYSGPSQMMNVRVPIGQVARCLFRTRDTQRQLPVNHIKGEKSSQRLQISSNP